MFQDKSIDNSFLSSNEKFQPNWPKMAQLWLKKYAQIWACEPYFYLANGLPAWLSINVFGWNQHYLIIVGVFEVFRGTGSHVIKNFIVQKSEYKNC